MIGNLESVCRLGVVVLGVAVLCGALIRTRESAAAQARSDAAPPGHELIATLIASGPHASLVQNARVFDRFTGAWNCEYTFHSDDGSVRHASGEVTFGWIIDGWAMQDTWVSYPTDGGEKKTERNIGTSIRFFDPKTKTWRVVWVAPAFGVLTTLQGGLEGDRIVLRGQDSDRTLLRWTFDDIRPGSFVWRGEKSRDGGKTWRLEEEHRMRRRVAH